MAARFGYTSDLTLKERRDMARFNRGVAITRRKNQAKRFLDENGPLLVMAAAGTLAVALIYIRRKGLNPVVGGAPTPGGLTP